MSKSAFICLDGVDGAGKSTQCRLLAEWLRGQGRDVVACHDPGGTDLGVQLREFLLHYRGSMSLTSEALLFMASRAQLVAEVIRPALDQGKVVITDRFLLANVVYQGYAGGLNVEDLWKVGMFCTGGLEPDLTLVLDLPPESAQTRRKPSADRLESRGEDYFLKVRAGYLAEASRRPDRVGVIDASEGIEAVHARVRQEVQLITQAQG